MTRSISSFINTIAANGGMSMSNNYDVEFDFSGITALDTGEGQAASTTVLQTLSELVEPYSPETSTFKLLCDEAQLPNVQSATGQLQGRYLGENQVSYPYAKFYTDLSLGWMCDANMTPLKFLTAWHTFIFGYAGGVNDAHDKILNAGKGVPLATLKGAQPLPLNRAIRLNYPNTYLAKCRITKTEKSAFAPNGRGSMMYILEDIYPYSIDAVPMSYGTSQVTKVTANFYYSKHTVVYNDVRKMN